MSCLQRPLSPGYAVTSDRLQRQSAAFKYTLRCESWCHNSSTQPNAEDSVMCLVLKSPHTALSWRPIAYAVGCGLRLHDQPFTSVAHGGSFGKRSIIVGHTTLRTSVQYGGTAR
jgi:hypothetical protein